MRRGPMYLKNATLVRGRLYAQKAVYVPDWASSSASCNYLIYSPLHLGQCLNDSHWGPPKEKTSHRGLVAYWSGFPNPGSTPCIEGVGAWSAHIYLSITLPLHGTSTPITPVNLNPLGNTHNKFWAILGGWVLPVGATSDTIMYLLVCCQQLFCNVCQSIRELDI